MEAEEIICLLTKRKYVYILLIMKEQHHHEVNRAKVLPDLSDVVLLASDPYIFLS